MPSLGYGPGVGTPWSTARGGIRHRVAVAVLVAVLAACAGKDDASSPSPADSPPKTTVGGSGPGVGPGVAVEEGPPPELAVADSWPVANGDLGSTRSVLDSPITGATVTDLEVAWEAELPGSAQMGVAAVNPVVVGDTVYVGDLTTSVRAFDLATGTVRWEVVHQGSMFGPGGVAVGWGLVFAPATAAGSGRATHLAAYDAADGTRRWSTELAGEGGQINMAPVAHGGRVYVGTVGFAPGSHGTLYALDAADGQVLWSFDTVDSGDLWGDPEQNHGGGAWFPPTVDEDRGVVYWGIGNPYPFPGAPGAPLGASRPGDNRYTDSIVALDAETGALRWYHQAVPHDLFDRDSQLTALAGLPDGGGVVVNAGKHGRVLGFDPDSGELRFDTAVGMHRNDDVTEWEGPLEVLPGSVGGVETPVAIADGILYAAVVNAPATYEPDVPSAGFEVRLGTYDSQLVAIDLGTGSVVWDVPLPGDAFGGATVVGDLVFTSVFSGQVLAFDRESGAEVWRFDAGGGINGWPAVAGDTLVLPVSMPSGRVVALRLG